ncbi:MAG: hypothetical protein AAB112_01230, partial [Thermodesulfobacteriota bacterium]
EGGDSKADLPFKTWTGKMTITPAGGKGYEVLPEITIIKPLTGEQETSLAAAQQRGVKIISIQFGPESIEIGKVFHHIQIDTVYERHSGELTIVVDESVGLFMSQPPGREWNGFWTTNPGVVKLMTNYIRHDIYSNKLIYRFEEAIKIEYGDQLQTLLNLEMD